MKNLFVIILLFVCSDIFAQEEYDDVRQQYEQINRLYAEIDEVNDFIAREKENLYNLKLSWYKTCVGYLATGAPKIEDVDKLINATRIEIDGEDLYNELARAKKCLEEGESYIYKNVPLPSKYSASTKKGSKDKHKKVVHKEKSSKKAEKIEPEVKEPEKKDDKDTKEPIATPEKPTIPVTNPEVKEEPIVSDPSKDKPGDEETIVETPVKNEDPPVEPETRKKEKPATPVKKSHKKADKGEMEEGVSKQTKNNDGSN